MKLSKANTPGEGFVGMKRRIYRVLIQIFLRLRGLGNEFGSNQAGQSLTQVLIALPILMMIMTRFFTMMVNQNRETRRLLA